MYKHFFKRFLDIICSFLALIVLSPVLLVTAILVRIKLGSPVIFKQKRPGLNEKIFTLYKFRTMLDKKDENGNLLSDSERLTKFGKTLRSTSIDELPELINILKGDMSIVGPRPLLVKDMVFMTDEQRKRHSVKPGLTGLAQVNGRNAISWEEKLNFDLEYLYQESFLFDFKLIFLTIGRVFAREGISEEGCDTAEDLGDYLFSHGKILRGEFEARIQKSKELG